MLIIIVFIKQAYYFWQVMSMITCQNIRAPMEIDLIENWSDREAKIEKALERVTLACLKSFEACVLFLKPVFKSTIFPCLLNKDWRFNKINLINRVWKFSYLYSQIILEKTFCVIFLMFTWSCENWQWS